MFEDLKIYVMFTGYSRSGSTLMGALLDAHPNAIVSREAHVLNLVAHGNNKKRIFSKIVKNSEKMYKNRVEWNGYRYIVPNQYHGRYKDKLLVIGDKKAGKSSRMVLEHPNIINDLKNTINLPVKFIHVIRNPFDNIATIGQKAKMSRAVTEYFGLVDMMIEFRKQYKEDIFEYKHEDFIDSPKIYLTKLCKFLGLKVTSKYLKDCGSIVFKSPHKTRNKIKWNTAYRRAVNNKIKSVDFLRGYKF